MRTSVLKNQAGLRNQDDLDQFEAAMVTIQLSLPFPLGRLDAVHYLAIHHHLFRGVYRWAGKTRTLRIAKGGNAFCYPENITSQMENLFSELATENFLNNLSVSAFATRAAHYLSELNVIHAFREGNGRTQKAFLLLLAEQAGHRIDIRRIDRQNYIRAMISAFKGDEVPLDHLLFKLIQS